MIFCPLESLFAPYDEKYSMKNREVYLTHYQSTQLNELLEAFEKASSAVMQITPNTPRETMVAVINNMKHVTLILEEFIELEVIK